jgi:hypothetical protein
LRCEWDREAITLKELDEQTRKRLAYENPLRLLFAAKGA